MSCQYLLKSKSRPNSCCVDVRLSVALLAGVGRVVVFIRVLALIVFLFLLHTTADQTNVAVMPKQPNITINTLVNFPMKGFEGLVPGGGGSGCLVCLIKLYTPTATHTQETNRRIA